ncbi:lipopolysaccharide biosynthesis protein [Nocardioides zeae]|uniref:Lipopolysaccharide biosynthesis protein n=1 Tax=Nocardioides imazamoxiresistens TaxID=3231893 RepID=A0ABU3PXQ3_9ACTN|nr:lipopolysaccharide biosynthesis protein [Nocardioides zeae]MDT9593565.1 lipopolysaccharide biosynthesis protein [Nocardioides zeae]
MNRPRPPDGLPTSPLRCAASALSACSNEWSAPLTSTSPSLGRQASRGAAQTLVWQAARIVIQFGGLIVLARLLDPNAFGLIAMIAVIVGIADLLRDFGLTNASIQAKTLSDHQRSNLFWLNVVIGVVLTLAIYLAAPLVADFYGEPDLRYLTEVLAGVVFINALGAQFRAEVNREMRFVALNATEVVPAAGGLIGAVIIAIATGSVWALVAQQLITSALSTVSLVAVSRWRPRGPNRQGDIRPIVKVGGGMLGTNAVAFSTRNADNIMIGAAWGATSLGLYSRAYQLVMLPVNQLLAPFTRVALPVLSRVQDDRTRFVNYLRGGQLVGIYIVGTLYALLIGFAQPAVEIVFGPAWLGMVPIVQCLAIAAAFRSLGQIAYWAYVATGNTGAQFRFYLVSQPLIVVGCLAGLPWGPVGVATALSVGYGLNWLASMAWCERATGLPMRSLAGAALWRTARHGVPAVAIALTTSSLVDHSLLAIAVGTFLAGSYWLLAFVVSRSFRADCAKLLSMTRKMKK